MIQYEDEIVKRIAKGFIPEDIFVHLNNAFTALDLTKDLQLFDIKQLKISKSIGRVYARQRMYTLMSRFHTRHISSLIPYFPSLTSQFFL